MINLIADFAAEDIEHHLPNDEEEYTECDVTHGPSISKSSDHQNDLASDIDEQEQGVDNVENDEQWCRGCRIQSSPTLESTDRNTTSDEEHHERAQSQKPYRKSGTIFIDLEPDETVDEEASEQGGRQPSLDSNEIGVRSGSDGDDTRVQA